MHSSTSTTTLRSSMPTRRLIKRVFSNLIQNAVSHSSSRSTSSISARQSGDAMLFTVATTVPGFRRNITR